MGKFVTGAKLSNDIFMALHEQGLITEDPNSVRRVIIDLEVGEAARLYFESYADEKLAKVAFGIEELTAA